MITETTNLWHDTVPRAALIYGHFGSRLTSRQRGSEMTIVDFATKDECDLHLLLGTLLTACPVRGLYISTNGKLRHCQCWWTYWLTKFAFLWSRRTTGPVCPCDWTPALKINNLGVIHIWRVGSSWHYVGLCHIQRSRPQVKVHGHAKKYVWRLKHGGATSNECCFSWIKNLILNFNVVKLLDILV